MTDLQLLAMPKEELEDMVHQLDTAMEDMRENLHGCDWCCGGGDEAMWDLGDKRRKLAEILKVKTTEGESDE